MNVNYDSDTDIVQCIANASEPAFQPNTYTCPTLTKCCYYHSEPTCCRTDLTLSELLWQCLPWVIGLLIVFEICKTIQWLFGEEPPYQKDRNYLTGNKNKKNKKFTDEFETYLDDPVFGPRVYEMAPRYRLAAGGHQKQK